MGGLFKSFSCLSNSLSSLIDAFCHPSTSNLQKNKKKIIRVIYFLKDFMAKPLIAILVLRADKKLCATSYIEYFSESAPTLRVIVNMEHVILPNEVVTSISNLYTRASKTLYHI